MLEEIKNTNTIIKPYGNIESIKRPAINLEKAMEYAQKIFETYSFNAFNDEMLSKLLGHKTASTSVYARNRAALSHYNIIEKINEGRNKGLLKLSELYKEYATEIDLEKKQQLLGGFFTGPTIFKNILEWVPDLNNLNVSIISMYIMRNKGVDKTIAEETAQIFMESFDYCQRINSSLENSIDSNLPKKEEVIFLEEKVDTQINKAIESNKKTVPNHTYVYPFSNNRSLSISLPDEMNNLEEEQIEDIKDMLNLLINKLERAKNTLAKIEKSIYKEGRQED